jgi:uncharacterized protein DUF3551
MRLHFALIAIVTASAALAASASPGSAQESFYNKRFCAQGGGGRGSGIPDCSYNTWEQCVASARGNGRYCAENSFWHGNAQEQTTQGRSRRQRDR